MLGIEDKHKKYFVVILLLDMIGKFAITLFTSILLANITLVQHRAAVFVERKSTLRNVRKRDGAKKWLIMTIFLLKVHKERRFLEKTAEEFSLTTGSFLTSSLAAVFGLSCSFLG